MNNKFINNNGVNLLNTSKKQIKKTKVESQIEMLKQQEQEILKELSSWETKLKKVEQLIGYLDEVNEFSTKYLAEALKKAQKEKRRGLEHLIKNKVEFALKFEPAEQAFSKLVFQKIENQVNYLKSQLLPIQKQLAHQERIFARIEARRQGKNLLPCKLKNRWVVLALISAIIAKLTTPWLTTKSQKLLNNHGSSWIKISRNF